jgi:prepilin-type N-terminal cleavage/methylation domain-containing protein/prepilin-type processing-associated H-X9-DG protein
MNSSRRAFTLTEILVVIAVVGLLAAILFPVLNRVRANSRTSTCSSNLRQIGVALSLYRTDNSGLYPPVVTLESSPTPSNGQGVKTQGTWLMSLNLRSPLLCPDVDLSLKDKEPDLLPFLSGYAANFNLTRYLGTRAQPILAGRSDIRLRYPSLTVAAFDARPLIYGLSEPDALLSNNDMTRAARAIAYENEILKLSPAATRHQDGANYLFGDGHVKWFRPEQLSITPQNDGVHPGFGL